MQCLPDRPDVGVLDRVDCGSLDCGKGVTWADPLALIKAQCSVVWGTVWSVGPLARSSMVIAARAAPLGGVFASLYRSQLLRREVAGFHAGKRVCFDS